MAQSLGTSCFPDDQLRLESLEILLRLVKGIRGKLSEFTRDVVELAETAMQEIQEAQGQGDHRLLCQILEQVHRLYLNEKADGPGGFQRFGAA